MKRNQKVYHRNHGNLIFRVVSPPENNGFEYVVCEAFVPSRLEYIVVTDIIQNFR